MHVSGRELSLAAACGRRGPALSRRRGLPHQGAADFTDLLARIKAQLGTLYAGVFEAMDKDSSWPAVQKGVEAACAAGADLACRGCHGVLTELLGGKLRTMRASIERPQAAVTRRRRTSPYLDGGGGPEAQVMQKTFLIAADRALRRLPPELRVAVILADGGRMAKVLAIKRWPIPCSVRWERSCHGCIGHDGF